MKNTIAVMLILLGVSLWAAVDAVSEPVCGYKNSEDETVFLKYFPLSKQGQDYVDFGNDGKCVRRAICTENYETIVEDCSDFRVTCANRNRYKGVFPACCVKC